jgi:hypothetical protein
MHNFYEFPLNIICSLIAVILAAIAGYSLRSSQLAKKTREIEELEREMLQAHEEILEAQKDFANLEARVRDLSSPVISMKQASAKDDLPKKDGSGGGLPLAR